MMNDTRKAGPSRPPVLHFDMTPAKPPR